MHSARQLENLYTLSGVSLFFQNREDDLIARAYFSSFHSETHMGITNRLSSLHASGVRRRLFVVHPLKNPLDHSDLRVVQVNFLHTCLCKSPQNYPLQTQDTGIAPTGHRLSGLTAARFHEPDNLRGKTGIFSASQRVPQPPASSFVIVSQLTF